MTNLRCLLGAHRWYVAWNLLRCARCGRTRGYEIAPSGARSGKAGRRGERVTRAIYNERMEP